MGLVACSSRGAAREQSAPPVQSCELSSEPTFLLTATIQDLMDAEVDPAADFLWDSVATISRLDGVEERQPRTDEEWKEVRRRALTLIEASNLLVMRGRRVSSAYLPAAGEGDLDSTEMQTKIDANRPAFQAFAQGLHAAGHQVLTAIDARDANALFDYGSVLDAACESCHSVFWYPNVAAPP